MISIREVAQLAGVSPATVSRVINGTAKVSPEKQRRVFEVIQQTNFVPNEVARSLFKKSANTIGLIIPSIRNPYFTEVASSIDATAKEYGFRLFLCNVGNDLEQTRSALQMLASVNVNGVIIGTTLAEIETALELYPLPVVVLDRRLVSDQITAYVSCNHRQGGQLAMEHLLACGCQHIACIRGPEGVFSADARYQGYLDVCQAHGIQPRSLCCDYDVRAGLAVTEELLRTYPETDGILACNDMVAVSIYKILYQKHISVPEQIQLIGFDDVAFSSLMTPALTTIHQPIEEMGRKAAELILLDAGKGAKGVHHCFPVHLVQRETTRNKSL